MTKFKDHCFSASVAYRLDSPLELCETCLEIRPGMRMVTDYDEEAACAQTKSEKSG